MNGMDKLADITRSVLSITVYIPVDEEQKALYAIAAISVKTGIESVQHHVTPDCKVQFEKAEAKISDNTISNHSSELWNTLSKALEDEKLYKKVVPAFYKVEYVTISKRD